MCVAGTTEHGHGGAASLREPGVDRRSFLKSGAALAMGSVMATVGGPMPAFADSGRKRRTYDLTYRLVKDFPDFYGTEPVISDTIDVDFPTDGFYSKSWTFPEHIGTHIDAPGHFSQGAQLVDDLTADQLVAPLAVVDIRRKATDNPNAVVEPEDLIAYERGHGRIPERALVAMNSGWQQQYGDGDRFRGGAGFPDLNFPGFSIDATDWLVAKRNPVGIGVDTMSIDPGNSQDFAVHFGFLATNRYGIENLANLDSVPARGTLVTVGAVPWEDGSGGPCRVIAVR